MDKHVVPDGHITLIPSKLFCALTHQCWVISGEAVNTNVIFFGLNQRGLAPTIYRWPLLSWSYVSRISSYLCYQCLSPLMLWVRISIRARCTTLCDKVCQWLATCRWYCPVTPIFPTNKTDRHDKTEIFLKVALNTINQPIINWLQTVFDICAFLIGFENYEW